MTQRYVALHGGGGVFILALRNARIYLTIYHFILPSRFALIQNGVLAS